MKKTAILSILLASFMILSFNLSAQNNGKKGGKIPNLTEKQRTEIKDIRQKNKEANKKLREEVRNLVDIHEKLMREYPADMPTIEKNIQKAADKRVEMAKNRAKMHQDIRALLDDDQRKWYDESRLRDNDQPNSKRKK